MASRIYLRRTKTHPSAIPQNGYRDMTVAAGATGEVLNTTGAGTGTERQIQATSAGNNPVAFWSERIVGTFTIAGSITFTLGGYLGATPTQSTRFRAKLYKITDGGSDVETFIVQADATADMTTTQTTFTLTATPGSAVAVAPNERFVLRVFAVTPAPESTSANLMFDTTGVSNSWIEFTEAVAFRDNTTKLILRRTSTVGIGNFFDMLGARGSSPYTSGAVDTTAGGTEIQWRRLASAAASATLVAASIADTSNLAAYTSPSFTPVADRLYLLAVVHADTAPESTVPTVSTTTGLTFTFQVAQVFDTIASNVHVLSLFTAMKPSGLSAGTYTVNLADAGTGCCAMLIEVTGVRTSGTAGADAIRSLTSNRADAGADPAVTLPAFLHTVNGALGLFASDIATVPTVGTGFTSLGHLTIATPTTGLFGEWRATNDTSVDCTLTTSDWAGYAMELVAAQVPSATALEWISPRIKTGWVVDSVAHLAGTVYAYESNAAANAAILFKLFRRRPDGAESLIISRAQTELTTASAAAWPVGSSGTPTLHSTEGFQEDDRIVFRCYIKNVGTMAAGYTATLNYDVDVAATNGDSFLTLLNTPLFKAEGDPPASTPPSGLTLSGVGN